MSDLAAKSYKELQAMAKAAGIKANQKKGVLVELLSAASAPAEEVIAVHMQVEETMKMVETPAPIVEPVVELVEEVVIAASPPRARRKKKEGLLSSAKKLINSHKKKKQQMRKQNRIAAAAPASVPTPVVMVPMAAPAPAPKKAALVKKQQQKKVITKTVIATRTKPVIASLAKPVEIAKPTRAPLSARLHNSKNPSAFARLTSAKPKQLPVKQNNPSSTFFKPTAKSFNTMNAAAAAAPLAPAASKPMPLQSMMNVMRKSSKIKKGDKNLLVSKNGRVPLFMRQNSAGGLNKKTANKENGLQWVAHSQNLKVDARRSADAHAGRWH